MASFGIGCYFNYSSYASLFRAMCVEIGEVKLYFSFKHLICVETSTDKYITKEKFHHAEKHKNFIKNRRYTYKDVHEVDQNVLESMIFKDLLKMPFIGKLWIHSYYDYQSNTSKYKAMCVEIGDFKLYYSYQTLIAFETLRDQYITNRNYSLTTSGHKYSARNSSKNVNYVEPKVLKLITLTNLLKLPFEEAKRIAGFHCERVHFA